MDPVDPDPDSDPDPQHWFILIGRVQYVTVWYIMYRYVSLRYGILHVVTLRYFRYYSRLRYVSL